MVKLILSGLIFSLFTYSCSIFKEREELTMQRQDFHGSELKISGYYYQYDSIISASNIIFLYNNGIYLHKGGFLGKNVKYFDFVLSKTEAQVPPKYFDVWGIFRIENNSIKIERWTYGQGKTTTYLGKGTILNDSTFNMELFRPNDLWHFHSFGLKPDSTVGYQLVQKRK